MAELYQFSVLIGSSDIDLSNDFANFQTLCMYQFQKNLFTIKNNSELLKT